MSRTRANRLGMYADLVPVLDAALESGGGTYTLESHGAAVHWRQRAYRFRKLFAETYMTQSKYDRLTMPRIEAGSSTVVLRLVEPKGVFTPAQATVPAQTTDTDLLDIAASFAAKLNGDPL